jgi:hypothetical protein
MPFLAGGVLKELSKTNGISTKLKQTARFLRVWITVIKSALSFIDELSVGPQRTPVFQSSLYANMVLTQSHTLHPEQYLSR